jgi:hypothetical protein
MVKLLKGTQGNNVISTNNLSKGFYVVRINNINGPVSKMLRIE